MDAESRIEYVKASNTKMLKHRWMTLPLLKPKLPALREPEGALPRAIPAVLLHAERHAPRGVPGVAAIRREDP